MRAISIKTYSYSLKLSQLGNASKYRYSKHFNDSYTDSLISVADSNSFLSPDSSRKQIFSDILFLS